jgi:AraC family transcriptional regulator, ethanolamine operon transcriptional activator
MMSAHSILQYRFHNSEALSQVLNALRQTQTTIRQLSLKPFQCDLLLIKSQQISFSFTQISSPLHIVGAKAKGCLEFSFILQAGQQNFFAHELAIPQTTLFGFDPTREVNLIVPANSIICVAQIPEEVFDFCAEQMQRSDLNVRFLKTNFVTIPAMMDAVQIYLKNVYDVARHHPEYLREPQSLPILDNFIPLLIESIPPSSTPLDLSLRSPRRFEMVKQANEYMRAHLETPITLMSLCKALHTSERPLNYGFHEVFGVSPMAYLKTLRLRAVRTQLQLADPDTTAIAEVANRFSFQSLGHFSRDYKIMFGELPSETLKQVSRQ